MCVCVDLAMVQYDVIYDGGASPSDVEFSPSGGVLQLLPGTQLGSIFITVLDDQIPEAQELLTVRLLATTGDAVLATPTNATVLIPPNDDPNGVFAFSMDSLDVTATEGQTVDLM